MVQKASGFFMACRGVCCYWDLWGEKNDRVFVVGKWIIVRFDL